MNDGRRSTANKTQISARDGTASPKTKQTVLGNLVRSHSPGLGSIALLTLSNERERIEG